MAKKKDSSKIKYQVQGRIWVETPEGALLGNGRIELLMNVQKYGSITKAAKAMKMSYRQAWELIESMNSHSNKIFVVSHAGGKHGGGASLTETGEEAIRKFLDIKRKFEKFIAAESKKFKL
ncbi:MAG: LysR family transcriptional regulator [Cytophagaceae bacterium]|nr:LysR family transcriptional regulator [Cytophagaceae bacterium]